MADWEQTKKTVKRTVKQATNKIDELADKTALYFKIQQVESQLDDLYARLGRLSYRKFNENEDLQEEIATILPSITTKVRELEELNARYQEVGVKN